MQICVDLRCLQDPNYAFRGVGYHSSTLLRGGRQLFADTVRWVGLVDPELPTLPEEYRCLTDQQAPIAGAVPDADVFVQLSPMTHDGECIQHYLNSRQTFTLAVVYDFIPLDTPGRYLTSESIKHEYLQRLSLLARYDGFSAISQYSAKRLSQVLRIQRERISVSGVALRPEFEKSLSVSGARFATNPSEPYFLFVGGGDPRKNLTTALSAHAKLKTPSSTALIVVGNYAERQRDEAIGFYRKEGGAAKNLQFRSGVSDQELADLYRNCLATVCSSEIEGFSLPPVESLACGSAALISRNDAHREFIDNAEYTFDVHDSNRLSELMFRVTESPTLAKRIVQEHTSVPEKFRFDLVCERFWRHIKSGFNQMQVKRARRTASGVNPRLAVLTPFPPDRSGVADYTRSSLLEIAKYVDIDVFCETDAPESTPEVQNFYPLSDEPYRSDRYDCVLSVIGNSHFHIKIIEAQKQFGGPCLIHDNRLAELYNWWKGPNEFQKMASRFLGRSVGFEEAQEWIREPANLPTLFFEELIPSARPLLLHSKGIANHVSDMYGVEAQCLPFCVYRHFDDNLLTQEQKTEARSRLGIPHEQVAIISLGIVSPHKAPEQCIESISQIRKAGVDAHIYFVGSAEGQHDYIKSCSERNGVAANVHLCSDWISEQEYTDFIVAADFAIQLRTHFFGGLSGAMLDCIASGLTTIANDDLAFALDSPSSVLRIPDTLLAEDITSQILGALNSSDTLERITAEREEYLESHSFKNYAKQFCTTLGLIPRELSKVA